MTGEAAKPRILCLGRLYCDLIFTDVPRLPTLGTEVFAGGFGLHAGGGAFITAAYLSSLGHPTALACLLPGVPFRDVVLRDLQGADLDLSLCRTLGPETDPQVTVAIAGQGDRAFLTRRSGPAVPDLRATELRKLGVTHLHVGELSTLLDRPYLLALAREAGATISLDCGWEDDLSASRTRNVLSKVDLFLPNEAEARHLRECGVPAPFAALTVIKKGSAGATAASDGIEVTEPAKPVAAVDTTGAGDAFNAGFLSAWLTGTSLQGCLRAGNALGARAISGRGGFQRTEAQASPVRAGSEFAG